MNPDALSAALLAVIAPLAEARRPGAAADLTVADLPLERPRNRDHGDWASNAALKLGKAVGANPREFAQEIATALADAEGIASVEVAGPGFINIRLEAGAAGALAKTIVEAGAAFGTNTSKSTPKSCSDFLISSNIKPTPISRNASCLAAGSSSSMSPWYASATRRASPSDSSPGKF